MAIPGSVDDRLVQSVTRAFDVLFAVAGSDQPPAAGALAKELSLPRPTVHRILNTLVATGVISRVEANKGYVVTPKLVLAAAANKHQASLDGIASSYLHRLVAMGEETASLHVRTGDLRACLAEVQGSRGIRWVRGPGWSGPLWSGAVGRTLLAGLPDAEVDEVLSRCEMQPLARNTIVDTAAVRNLISLDRERGWSSSESETIDGAAAVAAPVFDANGRTIAALSLYAPADRLPHMHSLVDDLQDVARELGHHWVAISTVRHNSVPGGLHQAI